MKTVLFGAGAEVGYDLCSGKQFAKVVLGISDAETGKIVSGMKKAMKRFFKNRKYDYIPDYGGFLTGDCENTPARES